MSSHLERMWLPGLMIITIISCHEFASIRCSIHGCSMGLTKGIVTGNDVIYRVTSLCSDAQLYRSDCPSWRAS